MSILREIMMILGFVGLMAGLFHAITPRGLTGYEESHWPSRDTGPTRPSGGE